MLLTAQRDYIPIAALSDEQSITVGFQGALFSLATPIVAPPEFLLSGAPA